MRRSSKPAPVPALALFGAAGVVLALTLVPVMPAHAATCLTNPAPAGTRVTSGFGLRKSPKSGASSNHKGVDFGVATGTVLYATTDGTVEIRTNSGNMALTSGYGRYIRLHGDNGVVTLYGHLKGIPGGATDSGVLVRQGARVRAGDKIAISGNTGTSTGPHLHLETILGGNYRDPLNLLCYPSQAPEKDDHAHSDAPEGTPEPYPGNAGPPPAPNMDGWDDLSIREVVESEVARRYPYHGWLDQQADRGTVPLIVENVQMRALKLYMAERERQQQERIELLLAVKQARANRREMEIRLERQREAAAKGQ